MKYKFASLTFTYFLFQFSLFSQSYTQTVKGKVFDKETGITIPGVIVKMIGDSTGKLVASTDINGSFKIQEVPLGRQSFEFTFIGFTPVVASNIIVVSGKQSFLSIGMEESIENLKEIVVKANDKGAYNEMSAVSTKTFSIEETERYAGSRSDPARMASNFAGVQGTDDSRNDIVIRGNSPSGLLWRLEEIDIPNPNHFNVAGSAGGSVAIINNKYLSNSEFFTAAFPASYGNALGGVFDLKMRNGNNEKHERSFQFGFLGTELGLEGPINKEKGSSYLVNYRYSTLDLFSALNVAIGTSATPRYQDIGFRLNFPTKKAGVFSLSGIGGMSAISIVLSKDTVKPEELYGNQNRDQYFKTNMGVGILSHVIPLGSNTLLKTTVAHSASSINSNHYLILRDQNYQPNDTLPHLLDFDFLEQKTTLTSFIRHKVDAKNSFKLGFYVNNYNVDFSDYIKVSSLTDTVAAVVEAKPWNNRLNTKTSFQLFQPFFHYNLKLSDKLTLNMGFFAQYLTLNNDFVIEPRAGLKWKVSNKHVLSLGYGLHSQIQPTYVYFAYPDSIVNHGVVTANTNKVQDNKNLTMSKSQHFVLGYDFFVSKHFRVKAETYYQNLWDIPVYAIPSSFSLLNRGSGFNRFFPIYSMENNGTGENYGLELTLEKSFHKHYFVLFSGSLFNSTYTGSNGKEWNTDFNGNYVLNVLGGIEFIVGKKKKNSLTIGPKITYGGGKRYTEADRVQSDKIMDVVPIDSVVNKLQFPNYFRVDTRIAYKINGKKATYEIALDLVNLTGQQNVLALTYAPDPKNPTASPLVRNYQLGFLPLFYFKVDF